MFLLTSLISWSAVKKNSWHPQLCLVVGYAESQDLQVPLCLGSPWRLNSYGSILAFWISRVSSRFFPWNCPESLYFSCYTTIFCIGPGHHANSHSFLCYWDSLPISSTATAWLEWSRLNHSFLQRTFHHLTNPVYRMTSEGITQLQLSRRLLWVGLLRHTIQKMFVPLLKMPVSKPYRYLLSLASVGTGEPHPMGKRNGTAWRGTRYAPGGTLGKTRL